MKRAIKWGNLILVIGLIISGIAYLGHKQPFDPMTPIEESTANRDVLSRKSFTQIDVTAASADVTIKQGQHYTVSYYGKRNHAVHARVKNGILKVTQTPVTNSKLANFHLVNTSDEDRCIITVPATAKLKLIKGHVNNDLILNRVSAKKVSLDSNSGDISVLNSEYDGGHITTSSGDIIIRRSSLLSTKLATISGDILVSKTALTKGRSTLTSGVFTGRQLTITGHYLVTNQSGDNVVTKSNLDGARISTKSGNNKLKRRTSEGGHLERNLDQPNIIYLKNTSGDNTIK